MIFCAIVNVGMAQTIDWSWAEQAGGANIEELGSFAVDAAGNSYITGYYQGSTAFGPYTLANRGIYDVFVAKVDVSGNIVWASRAGGTNTEIGTGIAVDSAGNVYVTGVFNSSTIYFGNTNNLYLTRTFTSNDVFIAKLNSSGSWQWAKKAGGNFSDIGNGITLDSDSNIYICGTYQNNATFQPLPIVTGAGYNDIFVAKMNPLGDFEWVAKAGGANNDSAQKVVVANDGSLYVCGSYASTSLTFGTSGTPGAIVLTNSETNNSFEAYVAKLDSSGNWIWARSTVGSASEFAYDLAVDAGNNAYFTGTLQSATNFGTIESSALGGFDAYVAKVDSEGNWLWAEICGGNSYDAAWGISVDGWSNIWLTGEFKGTASFGDITLVNGYSNTSDSFLARMHAVTGEWLEAHKIGGASNDIGKSVALGPDASVYWGGNFSGSVAFGNTNLNSSAGSQDIYVAKQSTKPLALLAPNGGEAWMANSQHEISWSSANISSVKLDYSTDGGASWQAVSSSAITASLGSFIWNVPNINTNQALVKVWVVNDPEIFDVSDAPFSITASLIPPNADFTADQTSGLGPLQVMFTDSSATGSGTISSWQWDFGDEAASTEQHPQHIYQNAGTYTVSLTVTNSFSLTDTEIKTNYITITSGEPELDLLGDDELEFGEINQGEQSEYQNLAIRNSGNAPLAITALHFTGSPMSFYYLVPMQDIIVAPGDTTQIQVYFAPQTVGALSDTLFIVNNSINCPVLQIALSGIGSYVPEPPQAGFLVDITSGLTPLSIQFTNSSSSGSGAITSWMWDFGDGNCASLQNPTHTFNAPGSYNVSLQVTDSNNLTSTLTILNCITASNPLMQLDLIIGDYHIDCGEVYIGDTSDFNTVMIQNTGNTDLSISEIYFTGENQGFQCFLSDDDFLLSPGEINALYVSFGPLYQGNAEDALHIINDSQNQPELSIQLYGTGLLAPPCNPENLILYPEQNNVHIFWDPVTEDTAGNAIVVDYYAVFTSPDNHIYGLCGITPGSNFTQFQVAEESSQMFYYVKAVDLYYDAPLNGLQRQQTDDFLAHNLLPGMSQTEVSQVMSRARSFLLLGRDSMQ